MPRPLACAGRPKLACMAGTEHPSVEAIEGVLDAEPAERMRALAGLRNRLVHVYEEVDDGIVHESPSEGLSDLSSFSPAIARLAEA